jgi:hypothetical protein
MKHYPVVEACIDVVAEWLRRHRDMEELRASGEFDRVARDLGVTPDDLTSLVKQGPHAADELPHMLKALGIDQEALVRTAPRVLRDMERVCATCRAKGRCDDELAAGTAAKHYGTYCLNSGTIDSIKSGPAKGSETSSL